MIVPVVLAVAGMSLILFGLFLIYAPFALVGGGVVLVALAFWMEVPERDDTRPVDRG